MTKSKVVRITRHIFTDLEGYTIYHLCGWEVFYSSGSVRYVNGYSEDALNATQRKFYDSRPLRWKSQPEPYAESAWVSHISFY